MEKVLEFFRKHKLITILSTVVLVAAISLIAVSIALWDRTEDEKVVYQIPSNPAEKYLEYYAMVPNTSSESGYDYYALTRIPSELVSSVEGLAVSRYDGYASEVEIPSSKVVTIGGNSVELEVKHILRNYTQYVNNGLVGSTVVSVILPETISYVEPYALDGLNVYVKGGTLYHYAKRNLSNESVIVTDGSGNQIDVLVKKNGYYYSTVSYDKFMIVDGGIYYKSTYAELSLDGSPLEIEKTSPSEKVYGLENNNGTVVYQNEIRKNSMLYSLNTTDLFGNDDGYMHYDQSENIYYAYIVCNTEDIVFTLGNKRINLSGSYKHKVIYDATYDTIKAYRVEYHVGGVELLLDTNFNDYERYYSQNNITLSANQVVVENYYLDTNTPDISHNITLDNNEGSHKLTFAPYVVYTDGEDVTNYSLDTDLYLISVDETITEVSKTVNKEDGIINIYTVSEFDGSIEGNNTEYFLAFILPEGYKYYAEMDSTLFELKYVDGMYLLNRGESDKVRILGFDGGELVYQTVEFKYLYGYKYDFTTTSDFSSSDYLVEEKPLDINAKSFDINFDPRLNVTSATVSIAATYRDTFNDNSLVPATDTFTLDVTNNKVTVNSSDYNNTILMDDDILGTVYVFESYEISVNGVVIYSFVKDSYNELKFYQKEYTITNAKKEIITGSVYFDTTVIEGNDLTVSVNDNTLTVTKVTYNSYGKVIQMNRNYANTLKDEYYANVSSGWYVVSTSDSSSNIIESSYVYAKEAGIIYYSENGYSSDTYSVFTNDGIYVNDMVYEDGSSYISLPTYHDQYGYYVVNKAGIVVAKYNSLTGSAPLYSANTNEYNKEKESGYTLKVADKTYPLYYTDTDGILATHITDCASGSQITLYGDNGLIITTMQAPKEGNLKVYVNVKNHNVNSSEGWYNNYFNFVTINQYQAFKLVVTGALYNLVPVSKPITSNSTVYENTSKFESVKYSTFETIFYESAEGLYVTLINGYGTYSIIGSDKEFTLPTAGTYLVYFDEVNTTLVKVEGSSKYSISFDGETYYDMILNINNNNYLEYILTNHSLSSSVNTVYIKDDLNYVSEYSVSLEAGLYEKLYFAVDNQRRREGYEVFSYIKGEKDNNAIKVLLDTSNSVVDYYATSGTNSLPDYEDLFKLEEYQTFLGWYLDQGYTELYNNQVLENGKTYYAKVLNSLDKIYVTNGGSDYLVTTTSGAPIYSFDYVSGATYSFKVSTTKVVKEVTVGNLTLTPVDGVYTFNTDDLYVDGKKTPATVNVVLANKVVTITLVKADGSIIGTQEYETNTYDTLKRPATYANFLYYYDRVTGIVYTDSNRHLISPYMITEDITLTAAYSNAYCVTVNKHMPNGTIVTSSAIEYAVGSTVVSTFPRVDGYHYDNITSMMTTNGYPVEFSINEYLHTYSFNMPSANIIIDITYKDNSISSVDASGKYDTLYVLVPTAMASEVMIYDSTTGSYVSTTRMPDIDQIYQNYVVYRTNLVNGKDSFDVSNKYFKVMADGNESYYYELAIDGNKFVNDTFIIDNLGLENEVCNKFNWVVYSKEQNVYTFDTEFTSVHPIHGDISVVGNKVTITSAITMATFNNYQYATFEVIYVEGNVKLSYIVNYTAYGTIENPILINSGNDFKDFVGNAKFRYKEGLYFKQTNDILVEDTNGYEVIYNQEKPFNHIYDGNGYNITYIQSEIRNDVNNGLFGYIGYNATVENFDLYYELLDQNSTYGFETKYYLAPIASISLGTIRNVNTYKLNSDINANNIRYVGGLVAHNVGTIDNCTNNIEINLYNYGASESRILGGICGYNGGTIKDSSNLAIISLNGETGREQYVDGIAGMNKGTITNSYSATNTHNYEKDQSPYRVTVNGKEYAMYKNVSNLNSSYTEYILNGVTLYKEDLIRFYNSSKVNLYLTNIAWENSSYSFDLFENTTEIRFKGTSGTAVDIYFKVYTDGSYRVYVGKANVYTLEITNSKYPTRTQPLVINPANDKNLFEVMAVSVDLMVGDNIRILKNGSPLTVKVDEQYSLIKSLTNISSNGSYDFYYKTASNSLVISNDSHPSQPVNSNTIKIVAVDDWYFVDEIKVTNHGTYYFESAMLVEYFNGNKSLGTMVYNNAQTYDYNNMKTVIVDVLTGTTHIEVSRLMLISSRDVNGSKEKWYYAYDGSEFSRIGEPDKSYPQKTYSTGKVSVSSINDNVMYLYALTSGEKYATTQSLINQVAYVTGEVSVVGYVDVTYPTSTTLGSFRVTYYNGKTIVAVRSYVDGEQVEFLNGVTNMAFENINEGSGVRKIADLTPDTTKSVIEISPFIYTSNDDIPSTYTFEVNGVSYPMYYNPENSVQVMGLSVDFKQGDTVKIYNEGLLVNCVLDPYSSKAVSYSNGIATINSNGVFDIYYSLDKNYLYINDAVIYELVIFGSDGNPTGVTYKMYNNPSPVHLGEVMAIGVSIANGETIKIRKVGSTTYLTDINLDTVDGVATINNGVISFSIARAHDFFLYVNSLGTTVYVNKSSVDNYTINYKDMVVRSTTKTLPQTVSTLSFVNTVTNYNEGYKTRVYYLDLDGNYLVNGDGKAYIYEFDGAKKVIPIIENAEMLKILRYNETTKLEVNEVIVNAIYPGKTITLSNPYYGYYDISYSSGVADQQGFFLDNPQNLQNAYLEYVLNDGRLGHITMELNEGKFYVPFDSIIGLNPSKIAVTYGDVTTDYIELQYVVGNKLYEIRNGELVPTEDYTTFTTVYLYVDNRLPLWDGYFILSDGVYYEMNKSSETGNYFVYVAYVKGDKYQVTTNPSYSSVFATKSFDSSKIVMDQTSGGYSFTGLNENISYTFEFTESVFKADALVKELGGLNWTLSEFKYSSYDGTTLKGHQFGSGTKPHLNMTLTSDVVNNVTSVAVNTSGASGISGTLTVSVGGVQFGNPVQLTSEATTYTFTTALPVSGNVVLEYNQPETSKAIYIKSISIKTAEVTTPDEYNYEYYLQSDTAGLLPEIGLVENNGKFYGFFDLAEEVTYYVVDDPESRMPLSDKFTSDAGKHVIIYYEQENTKYEHTFGNNDDLEYGANIVDGVSWTITGDSEEIVSDGVDAYKFGENADPCTELELVSDEFDKVTNITINTYGGSGIDATLTVYVGDTQIGDVYTLTTTSSSMATFTSDTPLSGQVKLVYSQTSSTGIYIGYLGINPTLTENDSDLYDYYYHLKSGLGLHNLFPGTGLLGKYNWTIISSSGYVGTATDANGLPIGKKDLAETTLVVKSESVTDIKRIDIETKGASGTNALLTVSVGGVRIGTVNLTDTVTTYAFTSDELLSGEVVLTYNQTSNTAIYIRSIMFNKAVNKADVYRNEISYTVNAFYNGYKDRTVYKLGEVVLSPATPQIDPNDKYTFKFIGWNYGGTTYSVEEGTNKLYYLKDGVKVYLYCVSDMTITPVYEQTTKQFTVTFVNGDGTTVDTKVYNYGAKISSDEISAPNNPFTGKKAKFSGWYLTSDKVTLVDNYPVTSDMTVYAKWLVEGVFLVGTIEGDTRWEDQRDGYQFEYVGNRVDNDPSNDNNNFELLEIFLDAGDVVKPREFKITSVDYWFGDWVGLPSGNVCQVVNTNLQINTAGFYSFYIQKYNKGSGLQEIHVTYKEYMVSYEFDENDLVPDTEHDYPHYLFSLSGNETFELYSEEDKDIGLLPNGRKVNTPSLVKYIDNQKYVVLGWYTRPVSGERVTEVTENMVEDQYRNTLILYPVYILAGHYLVEGNSETFVGSSQASNPNALPRFKGGQTITINYYNGSVNTSNGVSPIDPSKVDIGNSTVTITGNTITFTQDGLYDIYQDEFGILHIEQYHEVVYRFTIRYDASNVNNPLKPQLYNQNIVSGVVYIQKYGSDLASLSSSYIYNDSGVLVKYAGWSLEGTNQKPIVDVNNPNYNQKVTGNQTFDIIYILNH